jgi:phytoene synthase
MFQHYQKISYKLSKKLTNAYSTSFSLGIKAFRPSFREAIYAVYGYVRVADEIVDSFHDFDKKHLLKKFREDTVEAIESGISTNPILHSFQGSRK